MRVRAGRLKQTRALVVKICVCTGTARVVGFLFCMEPVVGLPFFVWVAFVVGARIVHGPLCVLLGFCMGSVRGGCAYCASAFVGTTWVLYGLCSWWVRVLCMSVRRRLGAVDGHVVI